MQTLSDLFLLDSTILDPRISTSLFTAVKSVMLGAELSLTAIGRGVGRDNSSSEKHSIKRIDRLLGNKKLHNNRTEYHRLMASYFVGTTNPLIHVDWSTVYNYNFVMLRASISIRGRAMTLYEEVHPEEDHGQRAIQSNFLVELKKILPEGCQPIICTDSGFKVPWFKAVESHNWYWLARTRGTVHCQLIGEEQWCPVQKHHEKATGRPKELPELYLTKGNKHKCRGVLYKGKNKQRHNVNRKGEVTQCNTNKKQSKAAKEPWFLVTNLSKNIFEAHQLVNFYRQRMSIEESFRDCKNEYYGLGLRRSNTACTERLEIILLIAMLALFELYLLGKAAEISNYHLQFQANTIKTRRVLSYCFLGKRILQHPKRYRITETKLLDALLVLIEDSRNV